MLNALLTRLRHRRVPQRQAATAAVAADVSRRKLLFREREKNARTDVRGYARYRLHGVASLGVLLLLAPGCGESSAPPGPSEPASSPPSSAKAQAPTASNPAPAREVIAAVNHGVGLMGHYQYGDAAKAFEKALALQPELTTAQINLAIALFNRGEKEKGDIERSGSLLDEVLAREPDNLRALYFQAIVFQHIGNTEAAIPLLEQVVEKRPDDGAAWYLLGLCKQRLNQPAEAELLKAVEHRPYLYSAWYKLFQVAVAAKEADKAKGYMEKFKVLRESPLGESIELPQYNQMGDLALVQPLPASVLPAAGERHYSAGELKVLTTLSGKGRTGVAAADFNRDGAADLLVVDGGSLKLLLGDGTGEFTDATAASGLTAATNAMACAIGDFDNDEVADVFLPCAGPDFLFQGKGDGTFTNVTQAAGVGGGSQSSSVALFLDADHDADLDIFVGSDGGRCRLFRNNADGTFLDIAEEAGVTCEGDKVVAVLPGDLDGDRDADLVVLREAFRPRVFLNELLGVYREFSGLLKSPHSAWNSAGAALQDFDGDKLCDLLVVEPIIFMDETMMKRMGLDLNGDPYRGVSLWGGEGRGRFNRLPPLGRWAELDAQGQGGLGFPLVADVELDGDIDIALFGERTFLLTNDGAGHFQVQESVWSQPGPWTEGLALVDLNGDKVPDLVASVPHKGRPSDLTLAPGRVAPSPNAVAVTLTGVRGRDGRTRSPATGFGAKLTLRAGLHEQTRLYTGLNGGPDQSWLPEVFGLGGATNADYLHILWPDGVAQVEMDLAAGTIHKFSELQRKISSCPVLFAWNGERFGFVTDFAGVGGLGYFAAPGECSQPQIEEHVKIEPDQLVPKDGAYELRITEPMEEVAYVDRLELLVIDHPADWSVFPDERLAITGPKPTHDLLVVRERLFPVRATSPDGADCTANLREVDRHYAYEPKLDRRFIGFCEPHTLELDFGDQLADLDHDERVFLFINGFIEYPYSSTVYGASQAGVGWESIRIDASWESPESDDTSSRSAAGSKTSRSTAEGHTTPAETLTHVVSTAVGGAGFQPAVSRVSSPQPVGDFGRPADKEVGDTAGRIPALQAIARSAQTGHDISGLASSSPSSPLRRVPGTQPRSDSEGTQWRTIVPDAGVPGGMARMFTVALTGKLAGARKLRLTTNLEVCYDQIFVARDTGGDAVRTRRLMPQSADFRRVGFALEYSPDGRLPLIYDYERSEPTAPFHVQRGPYTRYGEVKELLQDFDDRYVMVGPGDEIAVRFDAAGLGEPEAGMVRSFILVSHAYCKDMDLYTATPETVEPLPFREMSRYPYPATEAFPETPELRAWQEAYNTRRVE